MVARAGAALAGGFSRHLDKPWKGGEDCMGGLRGVPMRTHPTGKCRVADSVNMRGPVAWPVCFPISIDALTELGLVLSATSHVLAAEVPHATNVR
eukprot:4396305-Amphidinium_carterae.1